jgi:hypothetical protein
MLGRMMSVQKSREVIRNPITRSLTLGVRYAGTLPRSTNSHGLPLQGGSQGEERCNNVRETEVNGRELTVAG